MIGEYVRNLRAAHARVRAAEAAMLDDVADREAAGLPLAEDARYHQVNDEARAAVNARRGALLGRWSR